MLAILNGYTLLEYTGYNIQYTIIYTTFTYL